MTRIIRTDYSPSGNAWTEITQVRSADGWWNIEVRRTGKGDSR